MKDFISYAANVFRSCNENELDLVSFMYWSSTHDDLLLSQDYTTARLDISPTCII